MAEAFSRQHTQNFPSPLISAALIVRNEEQHLDSCLNSIQHFTDEIVIVDTGSTDTTVSIAQHYTDKIFTLKWQDDFASARNFALNHCQGQWILYIDADERLRQQNFSEVRQQLTESELIGCYLWLHPTPRHTAYRDMRLFRNQPQVRFEGCIHENIWPALKRYQKASNGKISYCELTLDHVGYEGDQQHKYQRNLPLLLDKLADDPDHTFSWWHLGSVYWGLQRTEEAIQAWQSGIESARKQTGRNWVNSLSFISMIDANFSNSEITDPLLDETLQRYPDHPHLTWLQARIKMRDQQYLQAIEHWHEIVNWQTKPHLSDGFIAVDSRLFDLLAFDGLATCYFRLKEFDQAKHYYQLAGEHAPDKMEYSVKQQLCQRLMTN